MQTTIIEKIKNKISEEKQFFASSGIIGSGAIMYYLSIIYGKSFIELITQIGIASVLTLYTYFCLMCTKRILEKEITEKDILLLPIFFFYN